MKQSHDKEARMTFIKVWEIATDFTIFEGTCRACEDMDLWGLMNIINDLTYTVSIVERPLKSACCTARSTRIAHRTGLNVST